ncbi:MAG: 23S rRNA (adenine(2503)-C(2))-methyltransferase RlmN [Candidatus Margulisiibacteriota bacterium]
MDKPKLDLKNMTVAELTAACAEFGLPAFKARQVFSFIHQKLVQSLDAVTTLKLDEREKLKSAYFISALPPARKQTGGGVVKAAFKLMDGVVVEAVLMEHDGERRAVCVSSQVGCPVKCDFCATGRMVYKRNLTVAEILSQVYYFTGEDGEAACGTRDDAAKAGPQPKGISNVLFMGMGEPFFNYANVLAAAKILNHPLGLNIAARKIVFSTVGIIPGIQKLANEKEQFRLAWSLAAPFDTLRKQLVPLKDLPPLVSTIAALQAYQKKCGRRITIEYVLLAGVNDSAECLRELARISRSIHSNINLITYNPSPGIKFTSGNAAAAEKFLQPMGVNVVVRRSFGGEIAAACGQLAGKPQ